MKNAVFNVTFVTLWEEGAVSTSAKLDIETGRVFDIDSSDNGVNYQHLRGEVIEVLSGNADVDSRQFDVELLGDDDYYIVDKSDLALLRMMLKDSLDDTSDVTLNTFDDEGNVVDTTSMDLSKTAISDIIDHAAQLVLVLRTGGDVQSVLDELEESLVVSGVIADSDAEISLPFFAKDRVDVAKKLSKAIKAMGYAKDGKEMSQGHALEVVSKVSGLPNWDTLSGMLNKEPAKESLPMDPESIIDRHYRGNSSCCPYCHSDEVEGNSFDADSGSATQEVGCNVCGAEWLDVHRLVGVDLSSGKAPDHEFFIRMESDEFGADSFNYDSVEERIEGLKRLMADKALNDGIARTYTFFLFDGSDVIDGTEYVVAEWSGKEWTVDEYDICKKK